MSVVSRFVYDLNYTHKMLLEEKLKGLKNAVILRRISVTWYWNCEGTWEAYTDDDQKTITDAFIDGEKSATLTIHGGNYNISFYNKEGYFSPVQIRKRDGKNLIRKVDYSLSLVPVPVLSNIYPDGLMAPASEHASAHDQIPAPPSYEEVMAHPKKYPVTEPPLMTLV
jgi:hypothetical protein